jgi:5'-phosphate synthase pdxT subunit
MILLADEILNPKQNGQSHLGGLAIVASRNFFGSQVSSFQTTLQIPDLPSPHQPFPCVFIRAPSIQQILSDKVKVLARLPETSKYPNVVVAVRQAHILATAFHPELTKDTRWHEYFVSMARDYQLKVAKKEEAEE